MSIKITRPGIMSALQDAGRIGYRHIGIGNGGAMDRFALYISNYLVGNDDNAAVIEMHFPAAEFVVEQDAMMALTGADFSAVVDGMPLPPWRAFTVKEDSVIKFVKPVQGARAYLAVRGGWQAQKWLGSYSTQSRLGVGGYEGRALQKDDRIAFSSPTISITENKILPWHISKAELDGFYQPLDQIRCVQGPEYDLLDESARKNFENQDFIISQQSDRMGYRLDSPPVMATPPAEMISSATDAGTIQLLPDGRCIILMADHQTTGGYPRVASVINADLPSLAQAGAGQKIKFKMIGLKEAEDHYINMKRRMDEIKTACYLHLKKWTTAR